MTSAYLQQWIQHPEMLNKDTLYELRTLVARYPYFQSLRLLYLKNLYLLHDITFGAELRKAVLYVADRRVLFYLIEGDRYTLKSRKPSLLSSKVLEEEPSVDRTLSLIDAFLATIPEEHSQVTELDYTMDYTTYLLQDDGQSDSAPDDGQEAPKLRGHELIDGFIRKSESTELSVFERPVYLAEDSGAPEEEDSSFEEEETSSSKDVSSSSKELRKKKTALLKRRKHLSRKKRRLQCLCRSMKRLFPMETVSMRNRLCKTVWTIAVSQKLWLKST